jgi:hypothetical protein
MALCPLLHEFTLTSLSLLSRDDPLPDETFSFVCSNASVVNVDYLKSRVLVCHKNQFRLQGPIL